VPSPPRVAEICHDSGLSTAWRPAFRARAGNLGEILRSKGETERGPLYQGVKRPWRRKTVSPPLPSQAGGQVPLAGDGVAARSPSEPPSNT
jgi:hypothetical protein